tara:strand:+ start:480 stop:929 length:450 start_codon:yes stop_codon:yes gene_type:complete
MSDVELNEDGSITVVEMKKNMLREHRITLDSLEDLSQLIKAVVEKAVTNGGKWKKSNVLSLVKSLIELSETYKYITGQNKKKLVLLVLQGLFKKVMDELNVDDSLREDVMDGIEDIIEPALEIALFAAKGNIKLYKKKLLRKVFGLCGL